MSARLQELRRPIRLGLSLAFGLGLAGYLLISGIASLFSSQEGGGNVRLQLAAEAFARQPPDLDATRAHARAALKSDPLASSALTLLGRVAEAAGDAAQAEKLMELAAATASRDLLAHAWMLDHEARAAEPAAAVARLDWILRMTPQGGLDAVLPQVAPIFDSLAFVAPLAAALSRDPPWRGPVLGYLTRRRDNTRSLMALFNGLQAGASPPTAREMAPYLRRLVSEGWVEHAYVEWLMHTPPKRLENAGLLYNARFQHPIENMPFDWTFGQSPGVLVRIGREQDQSQLSVNFFGNRIAPTIADHLLMLPPGQYRFSGRQRAQNLETERGLRWRVSCWESPAASIAETPFLAGEQPWRPFSVEFTVSDTCRAQNLQLELPARVALERVIAGTASFTGLSLERR
jgi:hypothetical protein